VLDRDAYVQGNTERDLVWRGQTLEDADVVVDGDAAVLTAIVVDEVEEHGVPRRHRLRLTQVWVRAADGWLCLAGHAGPLLQSHT
jgi:ketosteroid isomerase-like protein